MSKIKLCSKLDKYEWRIGEHWITLAHTWVYLLAAYMDESLGVATVVAWLHLVVNDSSLLMQAETEEGAMPTQANNQGQVVHMASV